MAVDISLGTTIGVVVGEPATYNEAGFDALVFAEVGEVTSIGEYGGSAQINTNIPLKTGVVNKRAGSYDYGDAAMTITRDSGDSGQTALKDGFDGTNKGDVHSFEVTFPDGSKQYFTGVISSFTTNISDANSWIQASCNIAITNQVIDVAAGSV
jgi:hypothetical protein